MTLNPTPGIATTPIGNSSNSSQELFLIDSPLPTELLVRIQAALNPTDAAALAEAHRKYHAVSDPFGAAIHRFDDKDTVTLQEIRHLREAATRGGNPDFSRLEKEFKLDLAVSDIDDAELKSIIEHFPNITEIDASDCQGLTDAGLQHLSGLANLSSLDLTRCPQITNKGLRFLTSSKNLTTLNLAECQQITNEGLANLSKSAKLTHLGLKGCPLITNVGINHLSGLATLTSLDLSHCDFAGKFELNGFANLKCLDLCGCNQIIILNLPGLKNLTALHFWGCDQITHLNLEGCHQINDAHLILVGSGLTELATLNLAGCGQVTNEGLQFLTPLTNLSCLNLAGCPITNSVIQHLENFPELTDLNLAGCQIDDFGLGWLGSIRSQLADLNLSGCQKITDAGLEHLRKMRSLQRVHLGGCLQISGAGQKKMREWANANLIKACFINSFESKKSVTLQELRYLRTLDPDVFLPETEFKLDLSGSDVTDAELESIVQHFPGIAAIDASNCQGLTDTGLHHLSELPDLSYIALSGCKMITEAGIYDLMANLPDLMVFQ